MDQEKQSRSPRINAIVLDPLADIIAQSNSRESENTASTATGGSDAGTMPGDTDPARLSAGAAARAYSELVHAIGANIDKECDELIAILSRLKEANAVHREAFGKATEQYAGIAGELTGAVGLVRERVTEMAKTALQGFRAARDDG